MLKGLPRFRDFFVDLRLKEFRSIKLGHLTFIKFDSEEGNFLLKEYVKEIEKDSKEYEEILGLI